MHYFEMKKSKTFWGGGIAPYPGEEGTLPPKLLPLVTFSA